MSSFTPKHKQLFFLLNQTGLVKHRHEIVSSFTNGRSESTKDLTPFELEQLIAYLKHQGTNPAQSDFILGDTMRKRILSLCHQYGWTTYNVHKRKNDVDFERLTNWMQKFSYLHKPLNSYKYGELPKLVTQFESVVMSYLNIK